MNFGQGMTMVINLTSKLEWNPYDYGNMVYQIITETAPPSGFRPILLGIFSRTPKTMVHTKFPSHPIDH